jgi:hypothetical protein
MSGGGHEATILNSLLWLLSLKMSGCPDIFCSGHFVWNLRPRPLQRKDPPYPSLKGGDIICNNFKELNKECGTISAPENVRFCPVVDMECYS